MLSTRIITALVLVPAVLAGLFLLPLLGWALATLAVMAIAAFEWSRLATYRIHAATLFVGGLVLIGLALVFSPPFGFASGWPEVVVWSVCAPAVLFWLLMAPRWLRSGWRPSWRGWMTPVGWIVLIGAWVAVVQLRSISPWVVLEAMAVVWIADTAAYFAGRAFGRHKLAPTISPGKTWEGVYGAIAAVAVYALILEFFANRSGARGGPDVAAVCTGLAAAMILTALSIVGDLFESMLKRHAGVKDSGRVLPGHGGVLDRIDALLAAMPAAVLLAFYVLR